MKKLYVLVAVFVFGIAGRIHAGAGFTFITNAVGQIELTSWNGVFDETGNSGSVVIPATTNGRPIVSFGTIFSPGQAGSAVGVVMGMENVSNICDYAFYGCTNLGGIVGSWVTNIGAYAFANCTRHDGPNLDKCVSIGEHAFENCQFWAMTLGGSLKVLGDYAFKNCSKVCDFALNSDLEYVGVGAFYGCTKITGFDVDDGGTYTYVHISRLSYCSEELFGATGFKDFVQPTGWSSVPSSAFRDCTSLTNIVLGRPGAVGESDYYGEEAFFGCTNVSSITFDSNQAVAGAPMVFGMGPDGPENLKRIIFTTNVTAIADAAFYGNYGANPYRWVGIIDLPSSVTNVGINAFGQMTALTNIVGGLGARYWGEASLYATGFTSVYIPVESSFGYGVFSQCASLTNVVFEDGRTTIGGPDNPVGYGPGWGMFYSSSGLKSVTLPNTLTAIPDELFTGCSSLSSCDIPYSVRSIGNAAFESCASYVATIYMTPDYFINDSALNLCHADSRVYYFQGMSAPNPGVTTVQLPILLPDTTNVVSGVAFGVNGMSVGTHVCPASSGGTVIMLVDGVRRGAAASGLLRMIP